MCRYRSIKECKTLHDAPETGLWPKGQFETRQALMEKVGGVVWASDDASRLAHIDREGTSPARYAHRTD